MRARTCCFFPWFNRFEFCAPLVEAPRSYPPFSRQLTDVFARSHPLHGHSLKFPGVSLSLHRRFLSRKLCPILCATSRVHSTLLGPTTVRSAFRRSGAACRPATLTRSNVEPRQVPGAISFF